MNRTEHDYYEALGVGRKASVDEIKKAYRQQAVKHHPDQGGDEARFKEINEAYEVLSNPDKKQRYDQFGKAGLGSRQQPPPGGGFTNDQGFQFEFGDLGGFGDLFGDLFGSSRRSRAAPREVEVAIEIDFREAIFGVEKTIEVQLDSQCATCQGRRAKPGSEVKKCGTCKGRGVLNRAIQVPLVGRVNQQVACSVCAGTGDLIVDPCPTCKGRGVAEQKRRIRIAIPAGVEDTMVVRLAGQGETNAKGQAQDLLVQLRVKPDKQFTREGDLILSDQSIGMVEAALGTELSVATVDGPVSIRIPAGTQSGTDFKLAGHGVPRLNGRGRGDHIVSLTVLIPTKLNRRQKQLLADLTAAQS